MKSHSEKPQPNEPRAEDREGLLHRIEEKLNRLLGRRDDDWHERAWAPLDSPFASYSPNDPSPRLFGGPRADAPGWDPSLAGPRFDRIDPGSVGTHAAHPTAWRQNRKGPKAVEEPFRSGPKTDVGEAEPVTAVQQPGRRQRAR